MSNNIARILKIINDKKLVINKGSNDGVKEGEVFLVYNNSEKIVDPDTGEDLGFLEIVKGKGKVTHLQERMATIESLTIISSERKIIKKGKKYPNSIVSFVSLIYDDDDEEITRRETVIPFDGVELGDLAKPL